MITGERLDRGPGDGLAHGADESITERYPDAAG